jgi:hypothetical protein
MVGMARTRASGTADDSGPVTLTFRCEGDLAKAFRNFIKAQRVPPTKTDVMTVALQEFLRGEGHYPPKRSKSDD